jgi:hypothetical protein
LPVVFCFFAKTQQNYEEPPLERIRRETVFQSPLIEATLCGLTGGETNVALIHQTRRG